MVSCYCRRIAAGFVMVHFAEALVDLLESVADPSDYRFGNPPSVANFALGLCQGLRGRHTTHYVFKIGKIEFGVGSGAAPGRT